MLSEDHLRAYLAAHDADPTAHGFGDALSALAAQLENSVARYPLAFDMFVRPDGVVAGSSLVTGQTWRNALGTTSAAIANNRFVSSGGNAVAVTDLPGYQIKGSVMIQASLNVAQHDAWIYAWFAETTPAGVVIQRGSDRVRLGYQSGVTLVFLAEKLISGIAGESLVVRLDAATRAVSVSIDGRLAIDPTIIPPLPSGPTVGLRTGPSASINQFSVFQEFGL